jgi:hypothetical protein
MPEACVSLTDVPESSSVLASMFYHFEPDNDFVIRCKQIYIYTANHDQIHSNTYRKAPLDLPYPSHALQKHTYWGRDLDKNNYGFSNALI